MYDIESMVKLKKAFTHALYFLVIIAVISSSGKSFAAAQTEMPQTSLHPKIGLVLGGGSAGGFAHIGVLKWLEENRIPVDYITGTSMGGLMGGCYAMGMTPDDIQKLAESIDWNNVFNPTAPYDSLDFRRKEDHRDYPLAGMGFRDHKISIPKGLSIYQVDMVLSRVALQYSLVNNFKDLPIPFKCIATDIRKGKSVALESGSLGKALRATMSVPAVFTPVEYNGQLLVDGGILDNLPVKEAKAMGADVVIAVNIMAPSQNSDDIGSLISQTLDTVTANNVTPSAALADILVEPSLVELGLYKWDAVDRYVAAGYQAAERQKGILLKYSLDDAEWKQYLQERQKRCLTNLLVPQGIEVLGTTAINKKTIEKCLQPYIGKPVNVERLEKDLTALMGSGLYQNLSYQFVRYNGEPVLAITVQEKNYGPPFISFSTQSGFEHDNNKIETAVRLTSFNDIGPGSEIRIDLGIGTEPKMLFEIYQPLRDSKWFLAPSIYGKKEKSSLFEAGDRVADYQISNYGIACDLGYAFNKFSEGRLGYRNGYQDTHVKVGSSLGADYDGSVQAVYLKWKSNSGNDAFFPRSGLNIDSSVDWYIKAPDDGSNDFGLIENKVRWNIPVGRNDSFFLSLAGGSSLQGDLPLPQQFKLGGLFRLGAYSSDEFRGDNYILDNIGFFKSIAKMPTGSNIYLGVWMENGGVYENWSDLKIKTDLSFGIISSTILGPVFLSASFGEDSNTAYYLGLGYLF